MVDSNKLKAKLKVVLKAGDQTIAEVENPELWQAVLAAITAGTSDVKVGTDLNKQSAEGSHKQDRPDAPIDALVKQFAADVGVGVSELTGACDPSKEEPYIRLDRKSYTSWRKRTPEKGRNAVSPQALVATLLTLWYLHLKKKHVTYKELNRVLGELGVVTKNTGRAIDNCLWLQLQNKDQIRLHPSHMDSAVGAARAFILGTDDSSNGGDK